MNEFFFFFGVKGAEKFAGVGGRSCGIFCFKMGDMEHATIWVELSLGRLLHPSSECSPTVVAWGEGPEGLCSEALRLLLTPRITIAHEARRCSWGCLGTRFRLGLVSRTDSRPGRGDQRPRVLSRGDARKDGRAGKINHWQLAGISDPGSWPPLPGPLVLGQRGTQA